MKRVIVIRKYQTALPQFDDSMDESTGWPGWKPVQQASAQHPQHATQYLQGEYPEEFWTFEGKEASPHHGAAQHRTDDTGTYLSVGIRGDAPGGEKMKVGRRHMREDMPDKRQIVVSRKSAKDVPRYQREQKRREEKEARAKKRKQQRRPLPRGVGVFKHAESPEAKKHKKEYDTKYESTPERKKYRAELTQERRKRGVAGKGGKDMSHTARGTIVPEDRHANRARHFKERGTLKKNLNRWFKEKWVDVSRTGKDGKHPPCGRSKAKTSSKGYPKCRPSVKVSSKTPKTSGSMSAGQKRAATKRKRSKKQGVGGKPTIVKAPIHDTGIEGVRFAEGDDVNEAMGSIPKGGEIDNITPNQYLDEVAEGFAPYNQFESSHDAETRWNPHGAKSKENVARLIEGLKEGKVMGMPSLTTGNVARNFLQDGGHRMEALRQMGHGNKKVPVMRIKKEQKKLFQPGIRQANLFNDQTALVPTDFEGEQKAREEAQRLAQEKEARRQAQMVKVQQMKLKPLDKFGMLKAQMQTAQMILKGECMTPGKPAYDEDTAHKVAADQTQRSGRPIRAYRCVGMNGMGCGRFHLTSS